MELHRSNNIYKDIFDFFHIPIAVFEVRNAGQEFIFKDINKAAERLDDFKKENLLAKNIIDIFPEVIKLDLLETFYRVYTTGQPEYHSLNLSEHNKRFGWRECYVFKLCSGEIVASYSEVSESISVRPKHKKYPAKYSFNDITYESDKIRQLIFKAKLIANSNQPVLIYGESGVGKELLVNGIHNASRRSNGPFIALNCASLTSDLIESELFGYTEGAFTGAIKGGRKGKIELAHKGTLFLDEIGDMPLHTQAMFLRVLQEKQFFKIGSEEITDVDIRLVCASNKQLLKMCEQGLFRWDLYYRVAGINLEVPPLRERKEDIKPLTKEFLENIKSREGVEKGITEEAINTLLEYDWPGNIRELKNIIESAYILCQSQQIEQKDIIELLKINNFATEHIKAYSKKDKLLQAIEAAGGNITKAAQNLGVARSTVYRWLKEEGC